MKGLLKKCLICLLALGCVALAGCADGETVDTDDTSVLGQEFGPFDPVEGGDDYYETKQLVFLADGEEGDVKIDCEGITSAKFNGEAVAFDENGITLSKASLYAKIGDNYLEYETADAKYKTLVEVITTTTDFENGQLSSILTMDYITSGNGVALELDVVDGGKMQGEYCVGSSTHKQIRTTFIITEEYLDWAFGTVEAESVSFDVLANCGLNHYNLGGGNIYLNTSVPEAVEGMYGYTITITKGQYAMGNDIIFTAYGLIVDDAYSQINTFYIDNFKVNKGA